VIEQKTKSMSKFMEICVLDVLMQLIRLDVHVNISLIHKNLYLYGCV
jgi:hypothetical protein